MRQRIIPGTGLAVSEIGFGCGGNAGLMVRGAASEQDRAVARALDLGITYFDTAPDYGDGVAEAALGRALAGLPGHRAVVTSKVEVRREDLADVAGHVVRSAHASLRRLRLARLDILQIHNGPSAAPPPMQGYHHLWLPHFDEAAAGLHRLIEAGDVAYAGFVCRGGDGPERRTLLASGFYRMVNLSYSLLRSEGRDTLQDAADHQCGAAVFSPLAGGLLAGGEPHALARPIETAPARVARLGFLAEACGSLTRAAYRYVLMHPGVTTVIGGFSSIPQMEEAASVSGLPPLPADLLARIDSVLDERALA